MKKGLVVFLLFTSLLGFSQKNAVKVGLMGLNYGDMALGYERAVTDKSSINYNVGFINSNTAFIDVLSMMDSDGGLSLKAPGKGFHTAIEYRSYIGKKGVLRGLYLSPFIRYWNYNFEMDDEIESAYFDVDSKISSIGLGFQMGYHWVIYDKISIDWYFMGLSVEKVGLNADYTIDIESFDYNVIEDDVRDVFSDFQFLEKRLETTVNDDNLNVRLPMVMPGIKTGFTIGYTF